MLLQGQEEPLGEFRREGSILSNTAPGHLRFLPHYTGLLARGMD